jgi:hypothetical protein
MDAVQYQKMIALLTTLPEKIVVLHGADNVAEFVLYELCNHDEFGVDRAAFFVDSTDFNHLKGVVGVDRSLTFQQQPWQSPQEFSSFMKSCPFNADVRSINQASIHHSPYDPKEAAFLANKLNFQQPEFYSWRMRHDNQGFLIVQRSKNCDHANDPFFASGLHFLSFCPIF